MQKSETIGKLAEALSKLQGEVQDAHKDRQGYGYRYADLSSVLDIARPLCAKYQLAVSQLCDSHLESATPSVGVETVLMHTSGEWISSTLGMPIVAGKGMSGAQAAGSVITYARRYALAAILGIAQTDDDASNKGLVLEDIAVVQRAPTLSVVIPADILHSIQAHISAQGIEDEEVNSWLERAKVTRLENLTREQGSKLLMMLEKRGSA